MSRRLFRRKSSSLSDVRSLEQDPEAVSELILDEIFFVIFFRLEGGVHFQDSKPHPDSAERDNSSVHLKGKTTSDETVS